MEEKRAGWTINDRACDICGSTDREVFWERKPWHRVKRIMVGNDEIHDKEAVCLNCGLIYKNPVMSKDDIIGFYSSEDYLRLYKPSDVDQISKEQIEQEAIASVYRIDWLDEMEVCFTDKRILDIGSASGVFPAFMRSFGANVTCLEPSARKCKIQQILFNRKPVHATLESYHTDDKYTFISICDTMEHLWSPTDALHKIRNLLTDDGILFMEIPSAWYPYVDLTPDAFLSSVHLHTFTAETINYLLQKCGFRISYMDYRGHKNCMLITAVKGDPIVLDYIPENWMTIRDNMVKLNAVHELFKNEAVTPDNVVRWIKQYPLFSNFIMMTGITTLQNAGQFRDAYDLVASYTWQDGQPASTHYDHGTFLTLKGLVLRDVGHINDANDCFRTAINAFPGYHRYNFIKELIVAGKLPLGFPTQSLLHTSKQLLKYT